MSLNQNVSEIEAAVSAIRNLESSKAFAEEQIADNQKNIASAEEKLELILVEQDTTTNSEYLKASTDAWRASIKAYKASITAYQADIKTYISEIEAILKVTPKARRGR